MPLRHFVSILAIIALSGCSLPAPYQTYSPAASAPPAPPPTPIIVYGTTTTTPDMESDTGMPETTPTPAETASAPASSTTAASQAPSSQAVAICYNRLWNKPDAIKNAAAQACGNTTARVHSQGVDLNACPLLTPVKAVFTCGAASPR